MVSMDRTYSSFYLAVADIVEMVSDGWKVDLEKEVPSTVGFLYAVTYTYEGTPPVKKSRAEILADARAAKAAKKEST